MAETKRITLVLDIDMIHAIKVAAQREGRTQAYIIRSALEAALHCNSTVTTGGDRRA